MERTNGMSAWRRAVVAGRGRQRTPLVQRRQYAIERKLGIRRVSRRHASPARGGAAGIQGLSRAPAQSQGQGRVRSVHGGTRSPQRLAGRATAGLKFGPRVADVGWATAASPLPTVL